MKTEGLGWKGTYVFCLRLRKYFGKDWEYVNFVKKMVV